MTGNNQMPAVSDNDDDTELVFMIGDEEMRETQLIKLLKSSKLEDKNSLNTFIRRAIEKDFQEPFEILFQNGYRIGVMNSKGQTAVHLGFYDECYRIMKRHQIQSHRRTSESYLYDPNEVAHALINEWLRKWSDSFDCSDKNGLNYLHIACFMGNIEVVKKCLNNENVNTHYSNSESFYNSFTPLHFAVINNTPDTLSIINHLLEHGANVNATDAKGRTPLHLACSLFFDLGLYDDLNLKEFFTGEEILLDRLLMYPVPSLAIMKVLLEQNSSIDAKDKNGNTPLLSIFPDNYHQLSRLNEYWYFDHYDIPIQETVTKFAYLVKAGADISAKNRSGETILHLIIRNLDMWRDSSYDGFQLEFDDTFHAGLVEQVFKAKEDFDVNLENENGETPLQVAVNYLSYDIIKVLLDHGADMSHLKISLKYTNLFQQIDIVPNYFMVHNLIAILDLFKSKDHDISPTMRLAILRFLTHQKENCGCVNDLFNLLHYGSSSHIVRVLTELNNETGPIDLRTDCSDIYLDYITVGDLHIDRTVKNLLTSFVETEDEKSRDSQNEGLRKEVDVMKSTKLQENTSLFDIMTKHPYDIPQYIVSSFDFDVADKFSSYDNIIKGHLVKSTVRHYVLKYGDNSVKYLCPLLPELCCREVVYYLSNADIVNMFAATIPSKSK